MANVIDYRELLAIVQMSSNPSPRLKRRRTKLLQWQAVERQVGRQRRMGGLQ